jgi:hypothetical protein
MTSTSTTPTTTICHCAIAQAAPTHAVTTDAGRRGQPVHVLAFLASDDHARAQKPDAGHDALDHAALLGAGRRVDRQNSQGRAEAHEAEGAHPGLLAMQIAVEPEEDSDQGRRAEPNRDVEDVHNGTILAPQMAIYRLPGPGFPLAVSAAEWPVLSLPNLQPAAGWEQVLGQTSIVLNRAASRRPAASVCRASQADRAVLERALAQPAC